MKQVFGVFLPDGDTHFEQAMARVPLEPLREREVGVYQKHKLDRALELVKKRRVAIDVGAHVGFWAMWLAEHFKRIEAFEPAAEHIECFERNVTRGNVALHACALGAAPARVGLVRDPENSGRAYLAGEGDVQVVALDDFAISKVDFMKIDVEGAEAQVIEGAAGTIARCRPVIVFEEKGHEGRFGERKHSALDALLSMGMRVRDRMGGDIIMSWRKS